MVTQLMAVGFARINSCGHIHCCVACSAQLYQDSRRASVFSGLRRPRIAPPTIEGVAVLWLWGAAITAAGVGSMFNRIGIRLLALCAFATLLAIPSVALAQVVVPEEPAQVHDVLMMVGGYALTIASLTLRMVPRVEPLFQFLPANLRWLPGAVGGAAGELVVMLSKPTLDSFAVVEAVVVAVVIILAAALPGALSRNREEKIVEAKKASIPPVAMLLGLLVALALGGCAPSLAASAAAQDASGSLPGAKAPETCKRLSAWESGLRYGAVAGAAVAGGAGLTAIPVEDPDARRSLAIAAGSTAVVAGVAEVVRAELASDYVEGCE